MRQLPVALALLATLAAGPALAAPAAKAPAAPAAEKAQPITYVMATDMHTTTEASFTSKAAIVRFSGRTPQVSGQATFPIDDVAKAAGAVNVDLASLDTGISLRNEHMRGFLETTKYPTAVYKFTSIKVAGNKLVANKLVTGTATGTMTIHGVTRPLAAPVELVYLPEEDKNYRAGNWVQLNTEFKVKLSDYGIQLPKPVLGVKVADEVTIDVAGMAKAQ